ncbi:toxin [Pseudomonas sp. MG-9]|uniref:RHS repeat domain-containing protein n=1 Tax=Pseudomonas sp. MG-9 TaxID=2839032 RepID=UPI001BFFEEBA|nr:RHS repeat-associated core domain-containing protein [Pseudomonas sp. MG-9]MBT9268686.1 toxin [Pseudomonas sp. MG-9]
MKRSVHWRTPAVSAHDPRGLPARKVAYLRAVAGADVECQITRQHHDTSGHLTEQWDPRLHVPCLTTVYRLDGEPLKIDSVDAGWRLSLPGPGSQSLQRWDARGNHWRMSYDQQLRLMTVEENEFDVEVLTYAEASADAAHNLRGQLLEHEDHAGTLRIDSYALSGQPRTETRTFHDGEAFTSQRVFSPLGAVLEQIDAGQHRQQSQYGLAGQLKQVRLQLNGHTDWHSVLIEAQYNAASQIIEQVAGNRVRSRWTYDPADGRLHTHVCHKNAGPVLQDFEYFHDRVGNIVRIDDHGFQPVYFANQLIDGHRTFGYDSLYRLIRATGHDEGPLSDIPGLPQPSDPNNRLNYTQTYEYNAGGSLIKLQHVRAGASHTRQMRIDPQSNRGVRWTPGDAEPIFDRLFDRHGNLQALQPGQTLHWNTRDELASVILIHREDGRHDAEHYRYSQGERVFKRHETFTAQRAHFQQVRYLPGLEIRSKDNGEVLHVIQLDIGIGHVRCLHWAQEKPDELRYSLNDHLDSCELELDQQAQVISQEGYYPFGATAWMAARSVIEVSYRFIRYSGKEMDVSGLYYYGARYYAAWLQRWISADPAGDVDGLNLYAMVSNNPLCFVDNGGTEQTPSEAQQKVSEFSNVLTHMTSELQKLNYQLYNLTRTRDIYKTAAKKLAFSVATFAVAIKAGAVGSTVGAGVGSLSGPAAPIVMPVTSTVGAIFAAEASVKLMAKIGEETTLGYSIMPDQAALSVKSLQSKAKASPNSVRGTLESFNPQTSGGLVKIGLETTARSLGKHLKIPYLKQSLNIARQMAQLTEALNDSWGQGDLNRISARLDELTGYLDSQQAGLQQHLDTLAGAAPAPVKLIGIAQMPERADSDLAHLQQQMTVARGTIKHARDLLGRVSAYLALKQQAA